MPSRKKQKGKGKSMLKKEIRLFSNATPAEIIRGIHCGKHGAIRALAGFVSQNKGSVPYDERDGVIEALLRNLQRCDESLASVFGTAQDRPSAIVTLPAFCLSTLLRVETESHNKQEVCRKIADGISPVIKCMVHERRVFFQSTESWFESMKHFITLVYRITHKQRETWLSVMKHDGLLPFLGQAVCWSQCRQDIVGGFHTSNMTVPQEEIISTVHSIAFFLSQESKDFGVSVPIGCKLLTRIGAVAIAKGSELPAIIGMIRSYGYMCQDRDISTDISRNQLTDIITTLIWGGCVDETVMKELVELRDVCPEFVARCMARIICSSDSRFAGALRSGLFATTLSICAQLGRQDVCFHLFEGLQSGIPADELASGMIHVLYMLRLHDKTHKVLGSMATLDFQGLEDKLEHISRDAQVLVCANCLRTFDKKALKWCKGTNMLEPFCSMECLRESWDAKACADFGAVVEEDDDKRLISLKRNILQAGSKVFRDTVGIVMREYGQAIARGQGLTTTIDLRKFPPCVSSGLPSVDPSGCVHVTFIAEDFRGSKDGGGRRVLVLRKRFAV
ncbi:hypothetical protein THAOC_37129 [Thalassiosira oceanica]|uniref:MYND-type domain-containing protein n=1 Tax=Thalassiosira oceanica TaxID=159749 RepID=K0QYQ8_THAOC|nr:hypothetical protein THAOC_37129 [Thalassiosira oceanica]|eukprot:EJK44338.1 hypothetical protein THAOC_37129 [Thalassiosira oceanica]